MAASVEKTGRCVVLHEAPRTLGIGPRLLPASRRSSSGIWRPPSCGQLASTPPYPPARLERSWLPGEDRLLDVIDRPLDYDHA